MSSSFWGQVQLFHTEKEMLQGLTAFDGVVRLRGRGEEGGGDEAEALCERTRGVDAACLGVNYGSPLNTEQDRGGGRSSQAGLAVAGLRAGRQGVGRRVARAGRGQDCSLRRRRGSGTDD
jgi:hypothetical protein